MVDKARIMEWLEQESLPGSEEMYSTFLEGKLFSSSEGTTWDFKEHWPFSYSDAYFAGICRLICALSNNAGGVIVFGVHDKTRTGGRNKVRPNLDKLLSAFSDLTEESFGYDFRSYQSEGVGDIDVLLILPRPAETPPLRFRKNIESYKKDVVWFRDGHEVVQAQPSHFPQLFCRAKWRDVDSSLSGSIPPSAAQIKKFIGRTEVMVELFNWLQNSDEPRTYLHGKGGSGKTTIAHEFAKIVKTFGRSIQVERENCIDIVIFLSAKERELVTGNSSVRDIESPDFWNEESLLRKIIEQSGGEVDLDNIGDSDISSLRAQVKEYFNLFSYLLVIDDVDTLTTKGVDSGSDFLYRTLSRSDQRSKVLYTLRNAPSQSLHNSIEVPGLFGEEYSEFVSACVKKFSVFEPNSEFVHGRLVELSERRPLVIESIIALVRTCGSYDSAERLFLQNVGDDVRDYVFKREWDALPHDELARLLLAALADLNKPSSFGDLQTVLQASDSAIRDAIGTVREMFLSVDDAGIDTLFSLAPLTRGFVNSRKETVKFYGVLYQRVVNFKRTVKVTRPEVARLVEKIRRFVPLRGKRYLEDSLGEALKLVRDPALSIETTEDPVFRATRGFVEAVQKRPDMNAVRDSFAYSIEMGHEPDIQELKAWYEAEKSSGVIESYIETIADTVVNGKNYTEDDKIGMISRKATTNFVQSKELYYSDPERANELMLGSLKLHLKAFKLNANLGTPMLDVSEKYGRNTSFELFRHFFDAREFHRVFDVMQELMNYGDCHLDPVEGPLSAFLDRLGKTRLSAPERGRLQQAIKSFSSRKQDRKLWLDMSVCETLKREISSLNGSLRQR